MDGRVGGLQHAERKIVAVSDVHGAHHCSSGLDVAAMLTASRRGEPLQGGDQLDPAELLELDVEVLVPAAVEES